MGKYLQITDFRVKRAIVLYKSGKAIKPICKQLKMDGEPLRRFLKELGLLRTRNEAIRGAKSKAIINDNALDVLTPEALYWIGFIYADGHLAKERPRVVLGLSEIDKSHVQKFSDFFGEGIQKFQSEAGGMKANGYISNPTWRAQFSSKKVYERLKELGVCPGKTYDITPHELLKNSRDFWRGVVDGDGSVGNKKVIECSLCGHQNTIIEFLSFVNRSGINTETNPYKSRKSEHLYSCNLHHHKATATLKLLYDNATVYLDRKYEKYLEIIKNKT